MQQQGYRLPSPGGNYNNYPPHPGTQAYNGQMTQPPPAQSLMFIYPTGQPTFQQGSYPQNVPGTWAPVDGMQYQRHQGGVESALRGYIPQNPRMVYTCQPGAGLGSQQLNTSGLQTVLMPYGTLVTSTQQQAQQQQNHTGNSMGSLPRSTAGPSGIRYGHPSTTSAHPSGGTYQLGAGAGQQYYETPAGTHMYPPTGQPLGLPSGGAGGSVSVQTAPPMKRERKPIVIINPETEVEVDLTQAAKETKAGAATVSQPASSTVESTESAVTATPMTDVAAQFAAQVAATLTPPSQSKPSNHMPDHMADEPIERADTLNKASLQSDDAMSRGSASLPAEVPQSKSYPVNTLETSFPLVDSVKAPSNDMSSLAGLSFGDQGSTQTASDDQTVLSFKSAVHSAAATQPISVSSQPKEASEGGVPTNHEAEAGEAHREVVSNDQSAVEPVVISEEPSHVISTNISSHISSATSSTTANSAVSSKQSTAPWASGTNPTAKVTPPAEQAAKTAAVIKASGAAPQGGNAWSVPSGAATAAVPVSATVPAAKPAFSSAPQLQQKSAAAKPGPKAAAAPQKAPGGTISYSAAVRVHAEVEDRLRVTREVTPTGASPSNALPPSNTNTHSNTVTSQITSSSVDVKSDGSTEATDDKDGWIESKETKKNKKKQKGKEPVGGRGGSTRAGSLTHGSDMEESSDTMSSSSHSSQQNGLPDTMGSKHPVIVDHIPNTITLERKEWKQPSDVAQRGAPNPRSASQDPRSTSVDPRSTPGGPQSARGVTQQNRSATQDARSMSQEPRSTSAWKGGENWRGGDGKHAEKNQGKSAGESQIVPSAEGGSSDTKSSTMPVTKSTPLSAAAPVWVARPSAAIYSAVAAKPQEKVATPASTVPPRTNIPTSEPTVKSVKSTETKDVSDSAAAMKDNKKVGVDNSKPGYAEVTEKDSKKVAINVKPEPVEPKEAAYKAAEAGNKKVALSSKTESHVVENKTVDHFNDTSASVTTAIVKKPDDVRSSEFIASSDVAVKSSVESAQESLSNDIGEKATPSAAEEVKKADAKELPVGNKTSEMQAKQEMESSSQINELMSSMMSGSISDTITKTSQESSVELSPASAGDVAEDVVSTQGDKSAGDRAAPSHEEVKSGDAVQLKEDKQVTAASQSHVVDGSPVDSTAVTTESKSEQPSASPVKEAPSESSQQSTVFSSATTEVAGSTTADSDVILSTTDLGVQSGAADAVVDSITAESVSKLKYNYAEDQWSPLRPEGKKQYDRNFMLQLQFVQTTKPNLLPALDCVLPEPRTSIKSDSISRLNSMDPGSPIDFTPGFIKSTPSGSRTPRRGGGGSMRRDQGGRSDQRAGGPDPRLMGGSESQRKVINLAIQQDVHLHTSENAWKPAPAVPKTAGELQTEELYKKVRGILNKLTPQKFETLLQQVHGLPIDTAERLAGCIDIIFEKAISEPNFSVAYAHMAKRLLTLNVPTEARPDVKVSFRTLLLNRCQTEFEKDKKEETDIADMQKLIDQAETDEKRAVLIEDRQMAISKAKRRSLGLIRFIGELFKLKMLTEKIMHECLQKLLRDDRDDDSIECLCQLLTTIGQDIDIKNSPHQNLVDGYFKRLSAISQQKGTCARIKFMILDVVDLRKSDWVPRKQNNNPKTIEQIHKEAEEEVLQKHLQLQRANQEQRSKPRPPAMQQNRSMLPGGGPQVTEDGWTNVSRPPRSIVDPAKMKLSKPVVDDAISLGPRGRPGMSWQKGSSGGQQSAGGAAQDDRPAQTPNRFSALTSSMSESLDSRSRGSAGGRTSPALAPGGRSSDYRGRRSGPYYGESGMGGGGGHGGRQSQERSRNEPDLRRNAGTRSGHTSPYGSSRSASREANRLHAPGGGTLESSSRTSGRHTPVMSASMERPPSRTTGSTEREGQSEVGVVMSDEDVENKTKSLLDEFLHLNDLQEATACVEEISRPCRHHFIYHSLMQSLERTPGARQSVGALLGHLVSRGVVLQAQLVEGLKTVVDLSEELVIDISRFWHCLASLLSPIVVMTGKEAMGLKDLRPAWASLSPEGAGRLLALILADAAQKQDKSSVADLWKSSGLIWSEFIRDDQLSSFLNENGVEFTIHSGSAAGGTSHSESTTPSDSLPPSSSTAVPIDRLTTQLDKLISEDRDSNSIITWIQESVEPSVSQSSQFIRALLTSVCSHCIQAEESSKDKYKVNETLLKSRTSLLKTFIVNAQLELQGLYALQALLHKLQQPYGVLLQLFNVLYDEEVIREESFNDWRDSTDPTAQLGKGVALNSVNSFFKWLAEES